MLSRRHGLPLHLQTSTNSTYERRLSRRGGNLLEQGYNQFLRKKAGLRYLGNCTSAHRNLISKTLFNANWEKSSQMPLDPIYRDGLTPAERIQNMAS